MKSFSVVIILAALIIGGAVVMSNNKDSATGTDTSGGTTSSDTASLGKLEEEKLVVGTDNHIYGDNNAPVTLAVFSDFECPYCGIAAPKLKGIIDANQGKARLIFRQFPLPSHPDAQKAAEAAEAAASMGGNDKFWALHDKMFSNQGKLRVDDLIKYAGEIGLDESQFKSDLNAGKYADTVKDSFKEGEKLNVQGTPTIYLNNRLVVFRDYDDIAELVAKEIAKQ